MEEINGQDGRLTMREADFLRIKDRIADYYSSSLEYTDYEDVAEYEIQKETDSLILIAGFHREAACGHYHWAANNAKEVLDAIGEADNCLVEFIPKDWVSTFEEDGFVIRDCWMDYFMDSLAEIPAMEEGTAEEDFLKADESKEASAVTMACKGQSRGFTGQTEEWIKEWLDNSGEGDAIHKAILVKRDTEKKITGLVCTGIYGYDSKKGPIAWIREVAVRPEYQNRGIARELIGKALRYCKYHGAKRAFLAADECNLHAIHLYRSIGFCPGAGEGQIDMVRNKVKNKSGIADKLAICRE